MKKLIFTAILTFSLLSCKSQTIPLTRDNYADIPNGAYVKDFDGKLNVFLGTWKWTQGQNEFTVELVKKAGYSANGLNDYSVDIVMGGYKYVVNGVVVVNTLTFNTDFNPNDPSSLNTYAPVTSTLVQPYNNLTLQVVDKIKNKACQGSFELVNPELNLFGLWTANQAHWKIWDNERIVINGQNMQQSGISIPNDIILTKVP